MRVRIGGGAGVPKLAWALMLVLALACGHAKNTTGASPHNAADDDASPASLAKALIVVPNDAEPSVRLAADDALNLLKQIPGFDAATASAVRDDGATFNIAIVGPGIEENVFTAGEIAAMTPESFRLRNVGRVVVAIAGADARGAQYGVYDVLERLGFRFFHPEQTYVPPAETIVWPDGLDVFEAPDWGRRGFHVHTMHPIEASEFLLVPNDQHKVWAQHLIDWLARNKQNYWQFELLRTVDYETAAPYFASLVEYSHSRGVDAGVVVTWVFQQQKAWKLMSESTSEDKDALEASLARIMTVPWDHVNLEMGTTEFTPLNDKLQVAWMNDTAAWMAANHPQTGVSVKAHCSSGQPAPDYDNINFNFLAQYADERMGVYPHTAMYYSLTDPAPVYGLQSFSAMYQWMLSMVDGRRKVYYYPETAYWVTFDIDVPVFLPLYILSRANDMAMLADQKLDGQVTFTSGHEWGYWLNDWCVARLTWHSHRAWTNVLDDFAKIFGEAGPEVSAVVGDLAQAQKHWLIERTLAGYLAGEDTWNELGYLLGTTTQPRPLMFSELYQMDADQVQALQSGVIADLGGAAADYLTLVQQAEALLARAPAASAEWLAELIDGFRVDQLNAAHAHLLWAGAAARRLNQLGVDPNGEATAQTLFGQAQALTPQYVDVVQSRETHYRYPLFYSTGHQRSVTAYDYRYLYQASNGYFLQRYEKQAIDMNFNPFLMNLIDPIWFFF